MNGALIVFVTFVFGLLALVLWNKMRTRGKIWCFFGRDDKSLLPSLCGLKYGFVMFQGRAYRVYPDFVRVARFPSGWPFFLQEIVPTLLYDEDNAIPRDWVNPHRKVEVRSMELYDALDENWLRKLVHETSAAEGVGMRFNWRKALPFILIAVGILGLIAMFLLR